MTSKLSIGDPWPFTSSRGLVGRKCEPRWHALITAPQKEARAKKLLESSSCEVMYPTVDIVRHVNGRKYEFTKPFISGIIYVRFRYEPFWDSLRERRIITGVFSRDNVPIILSPDDIARVMGLPTEAERLEAERIEAEKPRVGEKAEIRSGPLSGFLVDVERTETGRVWWSHISGLKGEADEKVMKRVIG